MLKQYHKESFELLFILNSGALQETQRYDLRKKEQKQIINQLKETFVLNAAKIKELRTHLEQFKSTHGDTRKDFETEIQGIPLNSAEFIIKEREQCLDALKHLIDAARVNKKGKPILPEKKRSIILSKLGEAHKTILDNIKLNLRSTTQLSLEEAEIILKATQDSCFYTRQFIQSTTKSELVETLEETKQSYKNLRTLCLMHSNPKEAEAFIRESIIHKNPLLNDEELEERFTKKVEDTKDKLRKLHTLLENQLSSKKESALNTIVELDKGEIEKLNKASEASIEEEAKLLMDSRIKRLGSFLDSSMYSLSHTQNGCIVSRGRDQGSKKSHFSFLKKMKNLGLFRTFSHSQKGKSFRPEITIVHNNNFEVPAANTSTAATKQREPKLVESAATSASAVSHGTQNNITQKAQSEPSLYKNEQELNIPTISEGSQQAKSQVEKIDTNTAPSLKSESTTSQEDSFTHSFIPKRERSMSTSTSIRWQTKPIGQDSGISSPSTQSELELNKSTSKESLTGVSLTPAILKDLKANLRTTGNLSKLVFTDSRRRIVGQPGLQKKDTNQEEKSDTPNTSTIKVNIVQLRERNIQR